MHSDKTRFSIIDYPLISVAVVDDHKLLAGSLSWIINESGIAQISAVYHDLKSCREGLKKEIPDVLLLDIELPDGDGVDFCAEITEIYPELKIIMLTSYKEFNIAKHALHNGAFGYILKNSEPEELIAGIETVNMGEQFLCEEIDVLLRDKRKEEVVFLTNTEKLVLKHIADGYTRKEIATMLNRDEQTVKTHWRNLMVKLNAKNAVVLIKKSYEMRLL
ncbi:MAG: response regulator transcription factor [Dysgonamonadaceae bacterium]|jgi:DNA-binding NarL/FixJ family response regulator|nr:response regulator transcription factor [Dysgonamonadaceae bacterium]